MRSLYLQIWLLMMLLFTGNDAHAQFNLSAHNGLPSDHVYIMTKDRLGYLWLGTTNGVACYNGYNVKVFNTATGLETNDIWDFLEDKKGRLWIWGYSSTPGYLYQNKYYRIPTPNGNFITMSLYMRQLEDGICYTARYKNSLYLGLFKEKNDSIKLYAVAKSAHLLLNHSGQAIFLDDRANNFIQVYDITKDRLKLTKRCFYDTSLFPIKRTPPSIYAFGNKILAFFYKKPGIYILDDNCKQNYILAKSSGILSVNKHGQDLFIACVDSTYRIDSNLNITGKWAMSKLTDSTSQKSHSINDFFDDDFWGSCLATSSNGVYLNQKDRFNFKRKTPLELDGYSFLGMVENEGYWWNGKRGKLAIVVNGRPKYYDLDISGMLRRVAPYDNNRVLLQSSVPVLYDRSTHTARTLKIFDMSVNKQSFGHAVHDQIKVGDTLFQIGAHSFNRAFVRNDTFFIISNYLDRFDGVTYSAVSNTFICFNPGKFVFYKNGKVSETTANIQPQLGKLEKLIAIDSGKGYLAKHINTLWLYRVGQMPRQLLINYNLINAKVYANDTLVIVAGSFGIGFTRIDGKTYNSVAYINQKQKNFSKLTDIQVSNDEIIINTDKDVYSITFPSNDEYTTHTFHPDYRLVTEVAGDQFSVQPGDTIRIRQPHSFLSMDIINPSGIGIPRFYVYSTAINNRWKELANNQLNLKEITPGKYHPVLLKITDDTWQSKPMWLHVYIIPFWWQTTYGQTIIAIFLLAGIVLLVTITISITRRIINRRTEKTQRLLELELKSMYAQINPHFIFNSLNSALYLIKKEHTEKAYSHISKFSHLLRFYLKSSRNRYITLAEEIANLRNYIELQQTRFANAFRYEITVDHSISTGSVKIPSLLLQPIVENAINHGLLPKESGRLSISVTKGAFPGSIRCIVEDDGIGRERSKANRGETEKESYGSDLIKELIATFNRYEHTNITIEYIDKQLPEVGTIVIVNINNPHQHG